MHGSIALGALDARQAVAEVLQEPSLHHGVDSAESSHLGSALAESGLEFIDHCGIGGLCQNQLLPLQVLQVLDCLLQYVRLLEL